MKKAVLVLAFGVLSATVALFAWDAELDAGPRSWLAVDPSPPAHTDNGYYALLGLFASPGADPVADGRARLRRANAALGPNTASSLQTQLQGDFAVRPTVVGTNTLCMVEAEHCLGFLRRNADTIRSLMQANEVLVDRYLGLYAYPRFSTVAKPGVGEPRLPLGDLLELHRLVVMQIGLEFLSRSRMRALEALKVDIVFQRRLLSNADSYELKMAALRMLTRDAHLYAQLIDSPAYIHRHLPTFDVQLRDLTDMERSLAKATMREFRRAASILMAASESEAIARQSAIPVSVMRALYKPYATVNQSYGYFEHVMSVTTLDSAEFAHRWPFEQRGRDKPWGYVYNPVGSLLSGIVSPRLEEKIMTLHDADGLLRMVRLKKRIRSRGIAAGSIRQFLEAEARALSAPYDGEPFSWDPLQEYLHYEGPPGGDPSLRSLQIPFEEDQDAS